MPLADGCTPLRPRRSPPSRTPGAVERGRRRRGTSAADGARAGGHRPPARGTRTPRPEAPERCATHCPERNPPAPAIRSTIPMIASSGTPTSTRSPARAASAGRGTARRRGTRVRDRGSGRGRKPRRSGGRRGPAGPPSRSPRVPRRRPRRSSQRVCQLRGSTRWGRRAGGVARGHPDADQVAAGPREHPAPPSAR